MKTFLAIFMVFFLSAIIVFAGTTKNKAKLGTNFRFNPNSLSGKYQNSPSTTATVENDKYLDDLLAPRKSFADREKQDKERN